MKVLQINAMNYSQQSLSASKNNENEPTKPEIQTQPSFKGLWGKETKIDNIDYDSFSGSETIDRNYYPFLDETSEEIKAIKEEYSITSVNHNGGQGSVYYYQNCHINPKLPFTKLEWAQYVKNKFRLDKSTRTFIETALKRCNLKQHIVR